MKIQWDAKGEVRSIEIRKRDRVKWPFKEQRFGDLRSDLDRHRASLSLQIQIMSFARTLYNEELKNRYGLA